MVDDYGIIQIIATHRSILSALLLLFVHGILYYNYSYQECIYRKSMQHTQYIVVKTSLSGFDITMWLQHLVLVSQMCSDRP